MIVVDTNLIAALLLEPAEQSVANAVLQRDRLWAAPSLWRSELRNVLVGRMRQSRMPRSVAEAICARAETLVAGREHVVEDGLVLHLAAESGCTAYDCEFVALAVKLGVALVTFDREVLAAFPDTAMHPERFASGSFWADRVSENIERIRPPHAARGPELAGSQRRRGAA